MDIGRTILAVKGDRAGRPWVIFWGDWLRCVDIPKCAPPLPLGNVGGIYHVHRFDLRGKLLLPSCVRWPGLLVVVIALRPLLLAFGT